MNLHQLIPSRSALTVVTGIVFAAGTASYHASADEWNKKTILTVNQTIQVRDRVLEPGQYVLKLYDSNSDRHVVQIFNSDQSHIIDTILAIPRQRMEPTDRSEFTFWETPAGKARALRAWFYPGDTFGQEFPYPKHLADVAMLETNATPEPAPPAPVTEPAQPEPTPQPEATTNNDVNNNVEEQPVETAEATPPPPPPQAPAATPEPAPQPAQELPKTGSPYPLIGISGGVLLGLYGLLKLKRLA